MEGRKIARVALALVMASIVAVPTGGCWAREKERQVVSVVARKGDVDLVAKTAFLEARSDGERGLSAVSWVIINRFRKDPETFGRSIEQVVFREAQISVWGNGRAQRINRKALSEHDPLYAAARHAAWQAMTGLSKDPTHGALYFHEKSIKPSWARRMVVTARIGRHVYYRPKGG